MIYYQWIDVSEKYYKFHRYDEPISQLTKSLRVMKNEQFAAQLLLWADTDSHYALDGDNISWKGVHLSKYRIEVSAWKNEHGSSIMKKPELLFVDYVCDDDGTWVSDPLLPVQSIEREAGCAQGLWIEERFDSSLPPGSYSTNIKIYHQNGYQDEKIITTLTLKVEVVGASMPSLSEDDFFLDLWQHPSNWSRTYGVRLWSDEHFEIIKSHLAAMARLGQKVVTIICSDYPWAGQKCYAINKNPSNLFEYNMAKSAKNKDGSFQYDFSIIERYIKVAESVGISREIDLFGLLGNWDRVDFGNPLVDGKDPIRIKYYDHLEGVYKFMTKMDEVSQYISALFAFLDGMNVWSKVRVISDEPDHPDSFEKSVEWLKKLSLKPLQVKSAIHVPEIVPLASILMDDISLGANIIGAKKGELDSIRGSGKDGLKTMTWYVCCFPKRPNNFLSSPRLENRLIGWFTHYLKLDGFLRWDFAIWPQDPYREASYKYPKWTAGDMFFVYPGKDMKPVKSQRLENLLFGIQDCVIMNELRESLDEREYKEIYQQLECLLGKKDKIVVDGLNVDMDYSLDAKDYDNAKRMFVDRYVMLKINGRN